MMFETCGPDGTVYSRAITEELALQGLYLALGSPYTYVPNWIDLQITGYTVVRADTGDAGKVEG